MFMTCQYYFMPWTEMLWRNVARSTHNENRDFCLRWPRAVNTVCALTNLDWSKKRMAKKPLSAAETTELVAGLNKLVRNLWWTWDQEAQELFQELSPRGCQNLYHNAVAILHEVSEYELRVRLQDHDFAEHVREVLGDFEAYLEEKKTWGARHAPALAANPVAYFSAEFGFHET